jgi:hypothetical protein
MSIGWVKKRGGGFESSKLLIYADMNRESLFFIFLNFSLTGGVEWYIEYDMNCLCLILKILCQKCRGVGWSASIGIIGFGCNFLNQNTQFIDKF